MRMAWRQDDFAAALVERARPMPEGLTSWNMACPARRFDVYRNNVHGALSEALAARYPVTERLVGAQFFRHMCRAFTARHLPSSPVLIGYGAGFPDFIRGFPAASPVPYLADVAAFESAHWESYHAADCRPVAPEAFAGLDPAGLDRLRFAFIPSLRIVRSRYSVLDIWRANASDPDPGHVDITVAQHVLLARPGMAVEIRNIPEASAQFLLLLLEGAALTEAAAQTGADYTAFDLVRNLSGLIQARIVSRLLA
jgi:hypothetical protein